MRISVVVCTVGRTADVARLARSLTAQAGVTGDVLIVAPDDLDAHATGELAAIAADATRRGSLRARIIRASRGLTRQRNAALQEADGDVIAFLDDDVTLPTDFLARAAAVLARPEFADVGGLTGYDAANWPEPLPLRWRLRRAIGTVPSLDPGDADRLGRNVPHAFAPDDGGFRTVGWLGGFCMLYRREAVQGLRFDEALPTYGGEDRDFSVAVGRRWRLVMCGELRLHHHGAPAGRASSARRAYECGFGVGRGFAKHGRGARDRVRMLHYAAGECAIDVLAWARRPDRRSAALAVARLRGLAAGYRSWRAPSLRQPAVSP